MAGATLYDRLGVAPDADLATLRAAYRGLARQLHPDLVATGAEPAANLAMALVNEAWRVLSDPGRRLVYDATLRPAAGTDAVTAPAGPAARQLVLTPGRRARLGRPRRCRGGVRCHSAAAMGSHAQRGGDHRREPP